MSGRHARRKGDAYQPPEFGKAAEPKQVQAFQNNHGNHLIIAADKRLHGEYPYDQEPGSKPTIDRATGKRRSE